MKKVEVNLEQIKNLLINQYTCPQIAEILNVNVQVIQRNVKKLSLPKDIYIKRRGKITFEELTEIEKNVLIGGILGDTWIGKKDGSFTHKLEHTQYVYYKYNYIKRLCSTPTIHNKIDNRTQRIYQQSFCKIATNPAISTLRHMFYKNNIKYVNTEVLNLKPLGLAVWFMDDGYKTTDGYSFATNCFSSEDKQILLELLKSYELDCTAPVINKQIYIKKNSKIKFTKLIEEFVPNCMKYKLHLKN